MAQGRVLLVGGGEGVGAAVRAAGCGVEEVTGLGAGLRALSEGRWLATLLSASLPGVDADLVARVAGEPRAGAVILVASRPSPRAVMESMRAGALDVLDLPDDAPRLRELLAGGGGGADRVALPDEGVAEGEVVGSSPQLRELFRSVGRVAGSPATVLITGESGTGKELVARAIHEGSDRARGAFVAVNCAAIPEDLLESELFGHERGAFTGAVARKVGRFERASGGTLFLDEIGDMSLVLQAKILRALQEREIERLGGEERIRVDVRVLAATHRDLAERIASGDFREDLFYRLAVVRLELAPLRERTGDVRELALHYAARFAREYGRPLRYLEAPALERLVSHAWPGNVRELRNVMERAVLVSTGETLRAEQLQIDPPRAARAAGEALPGYRAELSMAEVERLHMARVLESVDGHLGRAAEVLGMHRNTVSRKAQEYGIGEGR